MGRAWAGGVAGLTAAVLLLGAGPAQADGLHLLGTGEEYLWTGGCTVTYSMDERFTADYADAAAVGLGQVAGATNIIFTALPAGSTGDIRFAVSDTLTSAGLGTPGGEVLVIPASALAAWPGDLAANIRVNLVTHEALHTLGLAHDTDEGAGEADELMNPILPVTPLAFGAGDQAGLARLREANGCVSPGVSDRVVPAGTVVAVDVVVTAAPDVRRPGARARCVARGDAWDRDARRCRPRR